MSSDKPIHQGPRIPPFLFDDDVTIPLVTSNNGAPITTAVVSMVSFAVLLVSLVVLSNRSGGAMSAYLPILIVSSGVTSLASVASFAAQRNSAKRSNRDLANRYEHRIKELEEHLTKYQITERDYLQKTYPQLGSEVTHWQRRPSDDDFLLTRVGRGTVKARYTVKVGDASNSLTSPQPVGRFIELQKNARALVKYMWLEGAPVTVSLREYQSIAILAETPEIGSLQLATILAQVLFHHAPGDVLPIVVYPQDLNETWEWYEEIFRNNYYSASGMDDNKLKVPASNSGNRTKLIGWLFRELRARESARARQRSHEIFGNPIKLPHIVVCIDSPQLIQAEERAEENRMQNAALALALEKGRELGVTVISTYRSEIDAPADTSLLIDLTSGTLRPRPKELLDPERTSQLEGDAVVGLTETLTFERFTSRELKSLAGELRGAWIEHAQNAEMPSKCDLVPILMRAAGFEGVKFPDKWISDLNAAITIPVGVTSGDTELYLNLSASSAEADGPHGLLVGQTGSGKSVLLKTIVASLITRYSPTLLNLVLVDYKGGLAFGEFNKAPHTIAYLTNFAEASATARFLRMMESEILARQSKQKSGEHYPHLVVVIDEFSEMLSGPDGSTDPVVMRSLFRIVRLGRELKVHLLFATQRPDTNVEKLRGAVQYRICLRTNTPEDSTTVLGSPEAAEIPVKTRGRGYLLRGDNQLILFQSALLDQQDTSALISAMTAPSLRKYVAVRWPDPLPMPGPVDRTPLSLPSADELGEKVRTWGAKQRLPREPEFAVPIGRYDRPIVREQDDLLVDLLGYQSRLEGGPFLVVGDLNAGKTTTLQTLLISIAELRGPEVVRFYILGGEEAFGEFRRLPHTRQYDDDKTWNIADPFERAEMDGLLARVERGISVDAGQRPALLFVLDDLTDLPLRDQFGRNKPRSELLERAIRSRGKNIFVAYSMAKADFDLQNLITHAATRVSLYANDSGTHQQLLGRKAPFALDAVPGHGFVYTRHSVDETQIFAPVKGTSDAAIARGLIQRLEAIGQKWASQQ